MTTPVFLQRDLAPSLVDQVSIHNVILLPADGDRFSLDLNSVFLQRDLAPGLMDQFGIPNVILLPADDDRFSLGRSLPQQLLLLLPVL